MTLARAIAVRGVGYGSRVMALDGFADVAVTSIGDFGHAQAKRKELRTVAGFGHALLPAFGASARGALVLLGAGGAALPVIAARGIGARRAVRGLGDAALPRLRVRAGGEGATFSEDDLDMLAML